MTDSPPSLDQVLARRYWTQQDAQIVLAALEASGLALSTFARQHKVQAQRIALWRRKLRSTHRTVAPTTPLTFVQVGSSPSVLPGSGCRYEVRLAGGDTLCIEGALDAGAIRTLLALLRAGPAC